MGHIKIHGLSDTAAGGKPVDPLQGFNVVVSYIDDNGDAHPLPAHKIEIAISAGGAIAVCQITTAMFELDLPALDAAIVSGDYPAKGSVVMGERSPRVDDLDDNTLGLLRDLVELPCILADVQVNLPIDEQAGT